MIRSISKDEKLLRNTILSNLPTGNAFVGGQVELAIDIAKKYLTDVKRKYDTGDNMYLHALRVAVDVSDYAGKFGDNYRYDLVIIALLHDVIEDVDSPELRQALTEFRTGKNTVLEGILALTNDEEKLAELGKSKYMSVKFNDLSKNSDLFAIKLMDRIDNVASLKLLNTSEKEQELFVRSYLLETLVIYNNLCMNDFAVTNEAYKYYNELVTMIISDYKF
jgi:(p)ppGpp synthase/HD superfamily hydrolase